MSPERFWQCVKKSDGCWEWTAALNDHGYGVCVVPGRGQVKAHRYALELVGRSVRAGLFACHHCDNRKCVRPEHLYEGSASDNRRDPAKHGKPDRSSKLLKAHVVEIFALRNAGIAASKVAARFGVSRWMIRRIWEGSTWLDVTAPAPEVSHA